MRNEKRRIASVEDTLRKAVCPLCPPDLGRVERVCRRIVLEAGVPREAVARRPGYFHFRKPLMRVAAVLLLLGGAALLIRLTVRDEGAGVITFVNPAPLLDQMGSFTDTQLLTQALTAESLNIVADLAMLATAINDNSFAILF
ncbi:MAG: hypothetical protein PHU80_11480 [Kiritimatiellae bacterium]|nr:hypothetical protein [Kiritimatiellia bacterium]